jgi:WYL_2, Sm-like SH3 beta-barrel fold
MIINADLVQGVNMLTKYLCEGIVEVTFTKKDGTDRVMNCTKVQHLIPKEKQPKPEPSFDANGEPLPFAIRAERPLQLLTVFDVDKQDWRSFNYTTIKSIKIHNQGSQA